VANAAFILENAIQHCWSVI